MQPSVAPPVGKVWFVGAGPGAPDLITVRGYRALTSADVVLFDSLVDERLMEGTTAERVFVGKRCDRHSLLQEHITELIANHALAGRRVVRLKGGDPSVLGRVGEEMSRLAELGVPFEVVPGVTSSISAPLFAGIPVTHRGVADSFVVLTAHRKDDHGGFSIPPYSARTTLVLLMATRTAPTWQAELLGLGYPADLPVALISAASTPSQTVRITQVGEVAAVARTVPHAVPTLAVVGHVVRLRERLAWFEEAGTHDAPSSPEASEHRIRRERPDE